MKKKSPAKINLLLRVVGKREDGYHKIKTIFQKISLCDTISYELNGMKEIKVSCDSPDVPCDERNLVYKATQLLRESALIEAGANIHIQKRIPVSAGLGGGSSNAATTLLALNELWNINFSKEKLSVLALRIGADVPFFLHGSCSSAEGIGEKLSPLSPKKSFPVLLINPGFPISAKDAYEDSSFSFTPFEFDTSTFSDIESGDPARVSKHFSNDLEIWAYKTHTKLSTLKLAIEKTKPLGTLLSGSGPTIFATYRNKDELDEAAKELRKKAPFVSVSETLV